MLAKIPDATPINKPVSNKMHLNDLKFDFKNETKNPKLTCGVRTPTMYGARRAAIDDTLLTIPLSGPM